MSSSLISSSCKCSMSSEAAIFFESRPMLDEKVCSISLQNLTEKKRSREIDLLLAVPNFKKRKIESPLKESELEELLNFSQPEKEVFKGSVDDFSVGEDLLFSLVFQSHSAVKSEASTGTFECNA